VTGLNTVNQRRWPEVRERMERLEELRKSHVDAV